MSGGAYGFFGKALGLAASFVKSVSAFYVVTKYGFFFSKVDGPSMFPTFSGRGDIVVAEAVTPLLGELQVGDVVICVRPVDPRESIIKRIVALEGAELLLYPDRKHAEARWVTVPKGHIWVQGDNPTMSLDSRDYGPVPLGLVRGRAVYQLWPAFRAIERSSIFGGSGGSSPGRSHH